MVSEKKDDKKRNDQQGAVGKNRKNSSRGTVMEKTNNDKIN